MSQSSVYSIFQDSRGFLWFGTADGLNRFDGYEFKVYRNIPSDTNSIINNTIRAICEDSEGNLLLGTDEGLAKYLLAENRFIAQKKRGNKKNTINTLLKDRENIIAGTEYGIEIFSPNLVFKEELKLEEQITALLIDSHNNLWAGGPSGIYRRSENRNEFEKMYNYYLLTCRNIFETDKGSIFFLLNGKGILKYDYNNRKFSEEINDELLSNIFFDKWTNTFWIGTTNERILNYDPANKKIKKIITKPILNFQNENIRKKKLTITSIYIDRSNLLWVGLDGEGIYKFNINAPKFKKVIDNKTGADLFEGEFVKSIYKTKNGALFVNTLNGMLLYDFINKRFYDIKGNPFKNKIVYSVAQVGDDKIVMATNAGLFVVTNQLKILYSYFLKGQMLSLSKDNNGNIWFGATQNICRLSKNYESLDTVKIDFENRGYYPVKTISFTPDNLIWIGYLFGGLVCYNPSSGEKTHYVNSSLNSNSLSNNSIRAIYSDEKNNCIWIGTENGLNKFDRQTKSFTHYYEKDGLPNSFIYAILSDEHNNLWISTNKGISKFTPGNKPGTQFKNYGIEDGLQSNEFNKGAYLKDEKGYLYFGGINGLNYFHPDSVKDNPVKPVTLITGLKILDSHVEAVGKISRLKELKLKSNESVFSLQFSALEFTNTKKNSYAYRLLGFEKDWNYCGLKREARYTNLDPGEYLFEVKSANNDGVWNDIPTQLKILIVPQWYQTLLFKILLILFLLSAVGGSIRFFEVRRIKFRIKKLEEKEALAKDRARISRDIHDEIGANLTRILLISDIASSQQETTKWFDSFKQISRSANETIVKLDEIVWAINPKNDSLKNFMAYLSEYIEMFFEHSDKSCRFNYPAVIPDVTLTSEKRHNLFLAIKEALNNVQKYSNANQVSFELIVTKTFFSFSLSDDGVGFLPAKTLESGNSIKNMKSRIDLLLGEFELKSASGEGTTIKFTIKI
ncbi:MAG: hypothetical protein K8H86_03950 [Ignavibacteriaceae bacterium]|nr:hypothetical protein [Ignavibacteriaceae bacterium]